MRARLGILMVVLAATAACGGGSGAKDPGAGPATSTASRLATPTAPLTEITVPCAKFAAAQAKLIAAQRDLYTPSGDAQAGITELVGELNALKDGAPGAVQSALSELAAGFQRLAVLVKNPTAADRAELAQLAPKLSADGQKVSEYVVSKCS